MIENHMRAVDSGARRAAEAFLWRTTARAVSGPAPNRISLNKSLGRTHRVHTHLNRKSFIQEIIVALDAALIWLELN
jgi:hypothetical protein